MVCGAVSGASPSRSRAGEQKMSLSVGRCQVKQGAEWVGNDTVPHLFRDAERGISLS